MMNLDRILPRLFVGSHPETAEDVKRLTREFGITAVLNLQTDEDFDYLSLDWPVFEGCYWELGIELRRIPVRDFDPAALRHSLPDCVQTLAQLMDDGHTAYVHCTAGAGRSPSVVVAYLCWVLGWDLETALSHVLTCRPCNPNLEAIRLATEDRSA